MTTGSNKVTDRISNPEEQGKELTTGVPLDGSADPTGEYPLRDNWFASNVSAPGRGVRINDLWMRGSTMGVSFDVPVGTTSIFPFNQANETPSGHSFEIDDTPGNQRILIKHHTGAGVELKQDGSVLVASRTHQIQVVGADHEVIVQGEGNLTYDGDLNLTVNGNYNLTVGGSYNVDVGANHNHSVHGTYITETGDAHQTIVRGNKDTKVWGDVVDFTAHEHKIITKKDFRILSNRDIIPNARRGIRMSAEEHITTSAGKNTVISSKDLRLIGEKGKIGGEQFHFFGSLFTGGGDDTQGKNTVFHGNLVGRALEAWTAKYAKYSEEAHSAHISNFATKAEQADDAYRATHADHAINAKLAKVAGGTGAGGAYSPAPSTRDYPPWTGETRHDGTSDMGTGIKPNYQYEWGWNAKANHVVRQSMTFDGSSVHTDPDFWVAPGPLGPNQGYAMTSPESEIVHEPLYDYYGNPTKWWEVWNKTSPFAVRKVVIDEDGALEDKIAKHDTYSYYFNWTPSTAEIRSKLRTMDGAADASTAPEMQTNGPLCIGSLLDENRISEKYKDPAPSAPYEMKRTGSSEPTPRFGYTLLGNPLERASKTFTPKNKQAATRTIVADPVYNPDKMDAPITSRTRLSKSSTMSKFFGAPGSKTSLEFVPIVKDRQDLARQFYLHAWLMEGISSAKEFKNFRLQVTEGYYNPANGIREAVDGKKEADAKARYWREPYRKEDGGGTQKSIVKGGYPINQLKYEGRACVYTLYNSRGKIDYSAGFELALYIRDTFFYDQLSLDYDMTRPDKVMTQQLIVVMPKIEKDFKATFEMKVSTYFNRQTLSGSDLIEITD